MDSESSASTSTSEEPAEPPAPPRPPASTAAAVLLNVTGLGFGYAYLHRWLLAGLSVLATGLLLTGAFLSDAATAPWLWRGIALAWLGLLGAHAGWLARKHPRPTSPTLPLVAGVVAVAVVAGGYVGYSGMGHTAYSDGLAALDRGDCATAIERFDAVTGPYELTLSGDVAEAAARRAECAAFQRGADQHRRADDAAAVQSFLAFGRRYPHSTLGRFVHTNLAAAYVDEARDRTEPFTMPAASEAVNTLLMVRREFDDTPSAARALDAITDAFAAAERPYTQGKFCDAVPALTYFAGLHPTSAGAIVGSANTDRANALLRCGLERLKAGDAGEGISNLDTFVQAYPRHRSAAQARAALITARVAKAANIKLSVPPPVGGNTPGPWPLILYNDSDTAIRVLIAGPTAHDITLPACATCPTEYPPKSKAACASLSGLPSVTLRLKPGTYHYMTEGSWVEQLTDKFQVVPNTGLDLCIFGQRVPG